MPESQPPSPKRRTAWAYVTRIAPALGAVIAGVLCVTHVHLSRAFAQCSALPPAMVLVAVGVSLAQAFTLATRLWTVFPSGARPRWLEVVRAFSFGQFANACLPARAGDAVKVVAMANGGASRCASGADATGVVLADKALDAATLAGLVLVFSPALLVGAVAGVMHLAWVAGAALALAAAGAYALRRWWPSAFAKARRGVSATVGALRGLLTPRRLAAGVALAGAAWAAEAATIVLLAAPLGVHLSLAQAIVTLLVLNVGIAVPVSVANVGAYEAAVVMGLSPFGVAFPQAVAIGVVHHAVQVAAIALLALVFWVRDRVAALGARRPRALDRRLAPSPAST